MNNAYHDLCLAHFNEPIICHTLVCRLIGYGEDEMDCYLICRRPDGTIFWNTFVGGYTFLDRLKGQGRVIAHNGEEWDDLSRLSSFLEFNGCPKEETLKFEVDDLFKKVYGYLDENAEDGIYVDRHKVYSIMEKMMEDKPSQFCGLIADRYDDVYRMVYNYFHRYPEKGRDTGV